MLIRKETPKDYEEVYAVVKAAFDSAEEADGNEQDLVNSLRRGGSFVPELSLVAEQDGRIIGHILFTEAAVGTATVLALAPLSVHPDYQRQGVGSALIAAGHKVAAGLGYPYSVVLGHETYYPRLGYRPASSFGIQPPFDVLEKNFMAIRLREDAPSVHGALRYAKEFGID